MAEIKLNHNQLEEELKDAIKMSRVSFFVWGTTGIGKSQTVERVAKNTAKEKGKEYVAWNKLSRDEKHKVAENLNKYYILFDIRLSQMDPSDVRGLPDLNGKDSVEWKVPFWLHVVSQKNAHCTLLFDEINLAPPSIQASAYQLICDRALGEVTLGDDVFIVSAGNRVEDRANVYDMAKPLQNRFVHCELKVPHIDDWCDWAMKKNIDSRIITFLKFKHSLLFKFDPKSKEQSFPTPRSWGEYANRMINGLPDNTQEQRNKIKRKVTMAVGAGAAVEFTSFIKLRKTINLKDILNHPEKASDITEMDMKYSLLSLIADWYDKHYKKSDLETVLKVADNIQKEFAILMIRMVKAKHESSFLNNVSKLDLWKKELGPIYGKYLI